MKRKSVRIYSFTGTGSCLALKLAEKLKQEGYVCTGYTVARFAEDKRLQRLNDGFADYTDFMLFRKIRKAG